MPETDATAIDDVFDRIGGLLALGGDIARGYAESLRTRSPVAAYMARALVAAHEDALSKAIAILEEGLATHGELPAALALLAQLRLASGDVAQAEAAAQRASVTDLSGHADATLGEICVTVGRTSDAVNAFRRAMESGDTDGRARHGLGLLRWRQGDQARALIHFAQAFATHPRRPGLLQSTIAMYSATGWPLGALGHLDAFAAKGLLSETGQLFLELVMTDIAVRNTRETRAVVSLSVDMDSRLAALIDRAASAPSGWALLIAERLLQLELGGHAAVLLEDIDAGSLAAREQSRFAYLRGRIAEASGNPAGAMDAYEEALRYDATRWNACCQAIHLGLQAGVALDRLQRLLDRVPVRVRSAQPVLRLNEALLLLRSGAQERATALLTLLAARGAHDIVGSRALNKLRELEAT